MYSDRTSIDVTLFDLKAGVFDIATVDGRA